MNRHDRRKQKALSHKAQHYIAQGYLRAWCDPGALPPQEPYVWIFDGDGPSAGNPGKRKAPSNIFKEGEMYTITHPDRPGYRDLALEHGLQKLESDFCVVRRDFIEPLRPLGPHQRTVLAAFVASSRFRTPTFRDHTRKQWLPILERGRRLQDEIRSASTAQREAMHRASRHGLSSSSDGMTIEEVQQIVDAPLQATLASHVAATVPLLLKMTNLRILCTRSTPGFIASDDPVVWLDSAAHRRPPMFRAPALMYDTIEITMPISPGRMLFLGRQNADWPEYLDFDEIDHGGLLVDELNRRTCRHADKKVVVSRSHFRPYWAEAGQPPADSWNEKDDLPEI